jgi:2-C-methyl-D-erythritol 4-phosphate cytidylyltransferase
VTDTIKQRRSSARLRTLERDRLWAMETPQVFARDLLVRAYARVAKKKLSITDDAQAVESLDHPIAILENSEPNPKLTHPSDLAYLEFLLHRQSAAPAAVDSSAPFPGATT